MTEEIIIKSIDLRKILLPYENKWVALSTDKSRVLSSGSTLLETSGMLTPAQQKEATFMKVLPFDASYAPVVL